MGPILLRPLVGGRPSFCLHSLNEIVDLVEGDLERFFDVGGGASVAIEVRLV